MSQAMTYTSHPSRATAPQSFGPGFRGLLAVLALLAAGGLLATTLVDRVDPPAPAPRLLPAPSAAPVVAAPGSTTVPDASEVFAGRELEIENPAPTF